MFAILNFVVFLGIVLLLAKPAGWYMQRVFSGESHPLARVVVRPYGVVRIDSASGVSDWEKDPKGNTKKIAQTFKEAAKVAKDHGERLAAEGEICWGGMHSWKNMVNLLEEVGQPKVVGFQADMAHTLLYLLGYNEPSR